MRKLLFGSATLVALAVGTPANAAPPSVFDWSGFYIGANVGGSWGLTRNSVSLAGDPFGSSLQKMEGWLGGLQTGYNLQRGSWVFGTEIDIQATSQRSASTYAGATPDIPAIPAVPCSGFPTCVPGTGSPAVPAIPGTPGLASYPQGLPWFGTFRARLGVLLEPTWLLYVTGGLAFGEIRTNASFTIPTATLAATFSDTKVGWVIGAGSELALSPNWSFRIEYLYIDFGNTTHSFSSIAPFVGTFTANTHVVDHIVRIAFNYKFGGPIAP